MTATTIADERRTKANEQAVERAKQLLIFNQISVLIALGLGAYFYFGFIRSPWIVAGCAWLVVFFFMISEGRRRLAVATTTSVGVALLIGNWITALVITTVAPFTYPAGMFQIIIPVIAGGPVLTQRAILRTMAGATVLTAIICVIGLGFDDNGINLAVSERVQTLTLMIGLPVFSFAIGIGVWDAHQRQEETLRRERRSTELIRQSRQRLVAAADDERSRIERDLHDGAQQHLVAVSMQLRLLRSTHDLAEEVDPLLEDLETALARLRELAHGIYPPLLRSRGLGEAISSAVLRSPIEVRVQVSDQRYEPEVEACLYFCCLEAIQNAAKHGGPSPTVSVEITAGPDTIVGSVSDNGPGFDAAGATWGVGLRNMDDRVGALGGEFVIERASETRPHGTRLRFELPLASNQ